MAIVEQTIRGKKMILVEGTVDGFYINPIKPEHIKTYTGGKNGPWTPTHRYNLIVDGQPISLGMGDKDGVSDRQQIRAKDNDDNYHNLVKGLVVSVEVEEGEPYNGKPQYRSGVGKIVITDASKAEAPRAAGAAPAAAGKSFDKTGVEVGHAINGALDYLIASGGDLSNDSIISVAAVVHKVTTKLKADVAAANPDKSEFDVGASVGHAVRNACRMAPEGELEKVLEALSADILENVSAKVEAFVRSGKGVGKPATRTAAPKRTPQARKAKTADPVEAAPQEAETNVADMDDSDIPF